MNIPLETTLITSRCTLRCVSEEDIECVWSASRKPGFTDGMLWDPPETKENIVQHIYSSIKNWNKGEEYAFSVLCTKTAECIGRIGIRVREGDSVWNIGYWIHPDHQGKGYATEVTKKVIDWGFSILNAKRIESAHATWNTASEKVLQKAGFRFVKHLDCGFVKHGKEIPEEVYAITREEWNEKL